jgi:hypothetical protein
MTLLLADAGASAEYERLLQVDDAGSAQAPLSAHRRCRRNAVTSEARAILSDPRGVMDHDNATAEAARNRDFGLPL